MKAVDFTSKYDSLKFENNPVRIKADTDRFSIVHSSGSGRIVKECRTSEITKIQMTQSGGHYWFYFYFNDGQMVELRQLSGYSPDYKILHHQLKLVLAEAKRLDRASGSKRLLTQSVNNLLNADLISQELASSIRQKLENDF